MRTLIIVPVLCVLLASCGGSSSSDDPDPVDPSLGPITINTITLSGASDEDATVTARIDPAGADIAVADDEADPQDWSLAVTAADLADLDAEAGVVVDITAVDDLGNERTYTTEVGITTPD